MSSRLMLVSLIAICLSGITPKASAGDWPGWRGADRTDISKEKGLLQKWPAKGPDKLWMYQSAGKGYSGMAVVGNRLYTLGTRAGKTILICLDATNSDEVWTAQVGSILGNHWGDGPRCTPTVDGDRVYALGGRGNLICVNAKTGKKIWSKSLTDDLGGRVPGWGYTESVLIDGNKVICTPGGKKGTLAALDKSTGNVLWRSKDWTDGAQYSSPIVAVHNRKRQYIQLTQKTLAGVDAGTGKVLWRSSWGGRTAVIPTPIYHKGHVYISSGYGVGSKLVKIGNNNPTDVWESKDMVNHHGGVILLGDHLFGYSDRGGWNAQSIKTGSSAWRERRKLGKGAIAYADNRFYCISESDGTVVLLEPSTKGWKEHGRFTLSPQSEIRSRAGRIWTHPTIANGKLYLRDQDIIYCFDIKK